MHIEQTTNQKTTIFKKKILPFLSITLVIITLIPLSLILIGSFSKPTGNYLSPLPQGELAQATTTLTPNPTPTKNITELITLSQGFLNKAVSLSQQTPQTDSNKQQIISFLEQSLDYSNKAVLTQPNNPQTYLLRAQILTSIGQTNPQAIYRAEEDLEMAQKLANGQSVSLPQSINPLDILPSRQASLTQDLIVAAPQESSSSTASAENSSNATTTSVTLLAGQTQLQVSSSKITPSSYIYLIPQQKTNQPVYISSKTTGSFTISTNKPLNTNITIDYWIINH